MQDRCKACNCIYIPRFNKLSGKEEELCTSCLVVSKLSILDLDDEVIDNPESFLDLYDMDDNSEGT